MPQIENVSRERILGRIRSALREPVASEKSPAQKAIFPRVTDMLERFKEECVANITECFISASMAATAAEIEKMLQSILAKEIFVEDCAELRGMAPLFEKDRLVRWSSDGAPTESTHITITMCEALVAQTGSVLISEACGGRAASIIPPVHIVVATMDQLVSDLESGLARIQSRGVVAANSYICLITGSSRTADIEKILVMGAHGPRRLLVFLSLS